MFRTFAAKSAGSLYNRVERVLATRSTLPGSPGAGTTHQEAHDAAATATSFQALETEMQSTDRWISRARPTFLYVIYAMILWALPMGLVAAISPGMSHAITTGMTDYLAALPTELYTLFATGYLGYATLRQLGKVKGTDR